MPSQVQRPSPHAMATLSRLLIPLDRTPAQLIALLDDPELELAQMSRDRFDELLTLAHSNHVVVRAFEVYANLMRHMGDATRASWAEEAIAEEQARIQHALPFLHQICEAFALAGLDITVMKSLDHWPDLGSDLDLYTGAKPKDVLRVMKERFNAELAPRSWGDRLAQKWNFILPGLPESVEFHIGRLGQTGEQLVLSARMPHRSRQFEALGTSFPVPHASDRLMISTLQRMYRHFYFRLCDIIDSAMLVRSGQVDFTDLERSTTAAGIWEGVATYLVIVSDYLKKYGDPGLDLPPRVIQAAHFSGSSVYYAKLFLRVPIFPQAAGLYVKQNLGLLRRGAIESTARLSLLPWLATVAFVEHKRTGSDKGIW